MIRFQIPITQLVGKEMERPCWASFVLLYDSKQTLMYGDTNYGIKIRTLTPDFWRYEAALDTGHSYEGDGWNGIGAAHSETC
jgi:hypothetical protein